MPSILNVLAKIPGFQQSVTVTPEEADRGILPGWRPSKKAEAAPQDPEANWRVELEELGRRFAGMPSTEEAESRLAAAEASVKAASDELSAKAKRGKSALKTPFLSAADKAEIERAIAKAQEDLQDLARSTRVRLARARALVEAAKEWNPRRPRYEQLAKRKAAIDAALAA
jgi:hypothetical protein